MLFGHISDAAVMPEMNLVLCNIIKGNRTRPILFRTGKLPY